MGGGGSGNGGGGRGWGVGGGGSGLGKFTPGSQRIPNLKVHKRENFLGSDFEICNFS